MKRKLLIRNITVFCVIALAILFTNTNSINAEKSIANKETIPEKISVIFKDPNLASVIADKLGKDVDSEVTQADLDSIGDLDAGDKNIVHVDGVERLRNATGMFLYNNNISDLTPFSLYDFPNLNMLELSNNKISDISPLKEPTALMQLMLNSNMIDNIEVALTFKSHTNNTSGATLHNLFASDQEVTMTTKNNPKLSKNISKYGLNGTYTVRDIADGGVFNDEENTVEWDNLDLSIKKTGFTYDLAYMVQGGTWSYNAVVNLEIEPAIVKANYVSEKGSTLADSITLEGVVTKQYETVSKSIKGYTLTKMPDNAKGIFKDEDQTVNYIYSKDKDIVTDAKLNVIVNHHYNGEKIISENKEIDANKNIDLSKWLKTTNDGIDYTFDKLIITPDNKVIIKSKDMNHIFTKNNDNVIDIYYSTYKALPKTGSNSLYYLTIVSMIIPMLGLVYIHNRKLNN